jgi:hypothetical protein
MQQEPEITKTKQPRDPNLDNPAVKKHREIIRLQANYIQREMIADVVENSARGLMVWEAVLIEHLAHGWNPKDVMIMLKNYKAMAPEWRCV